MEEDKIVFKELIEEIENTLDSEYLKNNRVERLQPRIDKIIEKKKKQLEVLKKYI